LVVFGDEWGRHPSSLQHLVGRLAEIYPLVYVNTIGLRPPRCTIYDLKRAAEKVSHWMFPAPSGRSNGLRGGRLYSPVLVPFNTVAAIRRWNRERLVRGLRSRLQAYGFRAPILLVSAPTGAEVAGKIGERLLIYYITDQYAELPGAARGYVQDLENELLAEADVIFVTSTELQREKRGARAEATLLPHGVDFEHFNSAAESFLRAVPDELQHLPRPLLGFFGLLAPWVDFDLLERVARAFPHASVVLFGPMWGRSRFSTRARNLWWLGPRTYEELPTYAAHFDIGLIPFRKDRLTASVNPLKLLEYLALGLPVVSTTLPDIARFRDVVYEAATEEEFVHLVEVALHDRSAARRQQRFARAAAESWDVRVRTFQEHVNAALQRCAVP